MHACILFMKITDFHGNDLFEKILQVTLIPGKWMQCEMIEVIKNTCICPKSHTTKAIAASFYRTLQSPHSVQKIRKRPINLGLRSLKAAWQQDVSPGDGYWQKQIWINKVNNLQD